jgi:hypothetical protein
MMNKASVNIKKIGYLILVFIIIAFWGCGGGGSLNGSGDILGSDIITGDSQVAMDSSIQDIQRDTEPQDISDIVISDAVDDVANDVCIPNCANKECGDDGCGGSCGTCGDNAVCKLNVCECKSGFGNCNDKWDDGCEIDLSNDHNHCGSCISSCGQHSVCVNAQCGCENGYSNCDASWINGCEVNFSDVSTCGTSCSNIVNCGQNSMCISGVCGCNSGYANCNNNWSDGCEVDLNSISSCGTSCSNKVVCSTNNGSNPVCDNGICKLTCNSGYADCNSGLGISDGCEVNLNNPLTCGTGCGNITNCGQNSDCLLGVCDCKSGYDNCDGLWSNGCEKNLTNDANNCGGCGNSCGTNGACINSQCECIYPYLNCNGLLSDGCEVNKNTDVNNCGGCNNICNLPNTAVNGCASGSCKVVICVDGYGNCNRVDSDGCETDLTNVNSCGTNCLNRVACSNANGSNPLCDNGVCRLTCNNGYMDCNTRAGASDGCETNLNSPSTCGTHCGDITNCGANSVCNSGICDCISGYYNCNGSLSDGCEKQVDIKHLWSKSFGGSGDDYGNSVDIDNSGNVYITGYFRSSTIDFGGGALTNTDGFDIFLSKFDSNGNHLWSKRFGGSSWDFGYSVYVDSSSNVYITGSFMSSSLDFGGGVLTNAGGDCGGGYLCSDMFLVKFDSNGNHLWSKKFGGSGSDAGYSISVDNSGNVYVTGYFTSSTIDFGGGPLTNAGNGDIFLAKFDSSGNHLWSKKFGGSSSDWGNSVSVDSSGNVYITGYFGSSTIDFGGGALTNAGYRDIFLAKFDSNGNHLWSKSFGGSGDDYGYSVSVDSSGNVYITGNFQSSTIDFGGGALTNANAGYSDIFLAKFDSNGNHLWSKSFGGISDDYGNSVSVDSSGNVYITGYFKSSTIKFGGGALTNTGGYDIFLARFDSNGNHIWSKRFGEDNWDMGQSISVDISSNVYITGWFSSSTIDFGGCPLSNEGDSDIYLIKYAP